MSASLLLFDRGRLAKPTRDQVLAYRTHFLGGLVVNSPTFGMMPWWDSALAWCDPMTRQAAYAVKRAAGDTHAILEVPSGDPLYPEWGQFYSPDKFPARDWTNGLMRLSPAFDTLLLEILENGFYFHVAMDERQAISSQVVKLVAQRLKDLGVTGYGFTMPGYDGVFYGWDPAAIQAWGASARAINQDIYLGLEHGFGTIPLGEGGHDYQPGGRMKDFDIVLGECNPHTDTTWQILGRMIRPYHRPPDQPAGDDPNPPFVLVDSERGPRTYVAFESWNPYNWVRTNMGDPQAVQRAIAACQADRDYFALCGARYMG